MGLLGTLRIKAIPFIRHWESKRCCRKTLHGNFQRYCHIEQAEQGVSYFTIHGMYLVGVIFILLPVKNNRDCFKGIYYVAKMSSFHLSENFLRPRITSKRSTVKIMKRWWCCFFFGDGLRLVLLLMLMMQHSLLSWKWLRVSPRFVWKHRCTGNDRRTWACTMHMIKENMEK